MAKRTTGVGKSKQTRSHKTAKRLAIKREMLAERAAKKTAKKAPAAPAKKVKAEAKKEVKA